MFGHFQFELPVTGFIHHLQQQVAPLDGSVEQQLLGLKRRHHTGQRCAHRQPGETILEHGRLLGGSFHFDLGFHRLGLQLEFLIAVPLPRDIIPLRDQGRDQLALFMQLVFDRHQFGGQLVAAKLQEDLSRFDPLAPLHEQLDHLTVPRGEDLALDDGHQATGGIDAIRPRHEDQGRTDDDQQREARRRESQASATQPLHEPANGSPQRQQKDRAVRLGIEDRRRDVIDGRVECAQQLRRRFAALHLLDDQCPQRAARFAHRLRMGRSLFGLDQSFRFEQRHQDEKARPAFLDELGQRRFELRGQVVERTVVAQRLTRRDDLSGQSSHRADQVATRMNRLLTAHRRHHALPPATQHQADTIHAKQQPPVVDRHARHFVHIQRPLQLVDETQQGPCIDRARNGLLRLRSVQRDQWRVWSRGLWNERCCS